MATSSLTRMTVPVGSDANPPSQGLLMPKLKYRFRVYFQGLGFGNSPSQTTELTKQVIRFDRPNVTFENIDLPVYNSTIKIAGKHSWQDVTCEVRDDAAGNISRLVGEQLQKQLDFVEQSSAAAGIDYKFTTQFEVLDGGNGTNAPIVLETWNLLGCYLQAVNYNDANYGDNANMSVTMTIRYDNALNLPAESGVGAPTTSITGQGIRSAEIAGSPATG
jgi:hypothetical protein